MENPNFASLDKPFPCLICGKLLKSTGEDGRAELVVKENYGVYNGIDFNTTGGYGSRILDMNGPIYFAICDICILQRRHRILGKKMNSGAGRVGGEHLDVEIQNGVKFYEEWINYVKSKYSKNDEYWNSIEKGIILAE